MKLNASSFALAGALTISVFYSAVAVLMNMWPYETLKFIGSANMIPKLENLVPYIKVTPTDILIGVSIHFVLAYCFFAFIALFYNIFSR